MKLYLIPSACSLAAHILVREAELNVELIKVELTTKKLPDGRDYTEVAPKGQVTAMVLDNGELLTENIAVLFYLASLSPGKNLLPPEGTLEHIRTTEWLTFVATEIHKQIFWTIFNKQAPREYKSYIRSLFPARFAHINQQLEKTDFIAGNDFSIADTYLIWVLHMIELLGETIEPWQALTAYKTRMFERPSVIDALAFEKNL